MIFIVQLIAWQAALSFIK